MEKQKRYAELLARLDGQGGKIAKTSAEIEGLSEKQRILADEAIRDEVLGNSGWEGKKERAKKLRGEILELEDIVVTAKRAVVIIKAELDNMTEEVAEEIREQYRPIVTKALTTYIEKLRGGAAAAEAVRSVVREGERLFSKLRIDRKLGIERSGSAADFSFRGMPLNMNDLIAQAIDRCKINGLDVE